MAKLLASKTKADLSARAGDVRESRPIFPRPKQFSATPLVTFDQARPRFNKWYRDILLARNELNGRHDCKTAGSYIAEMRVAFRSTRMPSSDSPKSSSTPARRSPRFRQRHRRQCLTSSHFVTDLVKNRQR
jgi:hypothetical protein